MHEDKYGTPEIKQLVDELIETGLQGVPANIAIKPTRRGYPSILPYNKPLAARLAAELSRDEIQLLIKGLVLYSIKAGPSRSGGSASPVSLLFKEHEARYPEDAGVLCQWILENRVNPYEPYGYHLPIRSCD